MPYTVKQLANLAGVSVRTLHHYDYVGLLSPSRQPGNGYRQYNESDLLRLQQILFFRELDFPLDEIERIMKNPAFDMTAALHDQRHLLELKRKRLTGLMKTIDKTIAKLKHNRPMTNDELYSSFTKEEAEQYATEAKERWSNTDAYKQSQERVKSLTKDDWKRIQDAGDKLMRDIVANRERGASSPEIQALIAQHYDGLRTFYEPNIVMYRGLADMYVGDSRFAAFYEKYSPGLALFMRDAMHAYCDAQSK